MSPLGWALVLLVAWPLTAVLAALLIGAVARRRDAHPDPRPRAGTPRDGRHRWH